MTYQDVIDKAVGALADIAFSEDMTLEVAQRKARRVYEEIKAAESAQERAAQTVPDEQA